MTVLGLIATYFVVCYDCLEGCLKPRLGLNFWTKVQDCPMVVWGQMCGLRMACLWLRFDQSWDWIWDFPMPGLWQVWWPVMVVCVDCFVGISYAIISHEN